LNCTHLYRFHRVCSTFLCCRSSFRSYKIIPHRSKICTLSQPVPGKVHQINHSERQLIGQKISRYRKKSFTHWLQVTDAPQCTIDAFFTKSIRAAAAAIDGSLASKC
jgi:hypothetical protein